MAALTGIHPGRVFTARSFKRLNDKFWVNNYELRYMGTENVSDPPTYLEQVADTIANHEIAIHTVSTVIDRVVISTIEPDGVPYNPQSFFVKTFNLRGSLGIEWDNVSLPLSTCLLVKRVVLFGRSGNLLYRGALRKDDGFITPEGFVVKQDRVAALETLFGTFKSNLENNLQTEVVMAKVARGTGELLDVRKVVDFSVRALTTTKKLYNRYFDIA